MAVARIAWPVTTTARNTPSTGVRWNADSMCSIPHHFLSTDNIYPFASCRQVYLLSFQVVALACAGSIRRNGADARGVGYGQLILSLLGLVAVVGSAPVAVIVTSPMAMFFCAYSACWSRYFLRTSSQSKSGTVPFWVHQTVHPTTLMTLSFHATLRMTLQMLHIFFLQSHSYKAKKNTSDWRNLIALHHSICLFL